MASKPIAQPALYLDSYPTVEQTEELFTLQFEGLTLKLTPHAMTGLLLKSRDSFANWNAMNRARASGAMVADSAEIIRFPAKSKIVRAAGEAC